MKMLTAPANESDEWNDPMLKPSRRPIAKALWDRDRSAFVAQFSLPGLTPDLVRDRSGRICTYEAEIDAEHAALLVFFNTFESRMVDTRKPGAFKRLAPGDFAKLLSTADITPTFFAEVLGTTQSRVMQWLDGSADLPHWAHLAVRLLAEPGNFEIAAQLAANRNPKGDANE
jgi:DNA-binding transcriptional regulator YiaG